MAALHLGVSRPESLVGGTISKHAVAIGAFLLFRAMPDHAGKALQRHQRLAGIGPFLELFDRDVVERLTAGALVEQRAGVLTMCGPRGRS